MNGRAYYQEWDPFCCDRLRELMRAGLISEGEIDGRDIRDVCADDLKGFDRVHWFAGIAGWEYAMQLAGWPRDRPVWTASVPCQPYSYASVGNGGAKGQSDHRDLWPVFYPIARERKPATIFGEQVSAAIKWGWWDRAAMDLESSAYAAAAIVLRSDAFGAQHERKRLYWLADAGGAGRERPEPHHSVSRSTTTPHTKYGDTTLRARRALDGDFSDLLPCDGLSVVMERNALKGFGNAIDPRPASELIRAFLETEGLNP